MVNNNISFDISSGPIMSGTWKNPASGDTFTVKDVFFQDNQLIVQTTDNRYLDYNFVQNYVRCEDNEQNQFQNNAKNNNSIPKEVLDILDTNTINSENTNSTNNMNDLIIPEDLDIIKPNNKPLPEIKNIYDKKLAEGSVNISTIPDNNPTNNISNQQVIANLNNDYVNLDDDYIFLKRALTKTVAPNLKVSIQWDSFPEAKIRMLMDLLDVSPEKIADWYMNSFDYDSIKSEIFKSINQFIFNRTNETGIEKTSTNHIEEIKETHTEPDSICPQKKPGRPTRKK